MALSRLYYGRLAASAPPPPDEVYAASASRTDVQAAINAATDGQTVVVPAGAATWSGAVSISNKTISLRGAGDNATTGTRITHGGGSYSLLTINPGSKTGKIDISGFRFIGGNSNYWDGTHIAFTGPINWRNFRVHHCTFHNGLPWVIRGYGATNGVIDHCTFTGNEDGIYLTGRGNDDWTRPLILGTDDFFFIEDCTFNVTGYLPILDFSDGGRVVFRNNSVTNGFLETHDRARNGSPSANAWEIYNNTFSAGSTNRWKALDLSAGTGVIFGNTFTGDWTVPIGGIDYKTVDPRSIPRCDGTDPNDQNVPGESGWRCQYQIGSQNWGANAIGYPAYIWNNLKNGATTGMNVTGGANHVQAGRDFFNGTARPGYTSYAYPHPLTLA